MESSFKKIQRKDLRTEQRSEENKKQGSDKLIIVTIIITILIMAMKKRLCTEILYMNTPSLSHTHSHTDFIFAKEKKKSVQHMDFLTRFILNRKTNKGKHSRDTTADSRARSTPNDPVSLYCHGGESLRGLASHAALWTCVIPQ
jgi:hypothetical protein